MTKLEQLGYDFERALLAFDRLGAKQILENALDAGGSIKVTDEVISPALERIGVEWEKGTIALSQVYMSGRICEELADTILPAASPQHKTRPKMAIAVLADYHLLGKRIVYSVLRASGFELLDYGHGITVDDLVERTLEDQIELLLISALMLPSAMRVRAVRDKLDDVGAQVKIVVGGAPFRFDAQLWREVGADMMGYNATDAVEIVNKVRGELA